MRLQDIREHTLSSVGHAALDVAGFVPGLGEPADFINALWYAKQGDYCSALLSLISMIPEMGDVVAKGAKYFGKSDEVAKILKSYGPTVRRIWPKVKRELLKSPKWRSHISRLDQIVDVVSRGP
jgi:hypothetical protein